jgi:hypothetical protein
LETVALIKVWNVEIDIISEFHIQSTRFLIQSTLTRNAME